MPESSPLTRNNFERANTAETNNNGHINGVRRNQAKIFKQEIQHLLVGALDVFENLDRDTVTGFEQIMPTTPGESNRAKSSSTATPPRPAALKQIYIYL
ncbi:unnamed protein product [Porites evermanni]|uniref:Uncharacterized protein n=1 Tax=Porites evermanni TaxID=104178 RepID=A0ABN8SPY4_9CNID|nr:unnamed protein product [Porites evermanni]